MLLAQDKGLNHYQNQEYEAAQEYYESVLGKRGNQAQAHFGRGSSAFQQGDLETAKYSFEQSLKADNEQLKSKAMYNLGNTFYQNQKTEEALAFYRKALELDPTDKDAKHNYEIIRYQHQEQQEQEQDQQQQSELNKKKEAEAILNALRDKEKINQKFQIKKAASRKMEKDW